MPIYVADYLKDTTHLSAAEHGAYLLLIFHYWSNGSIPDDDARLARIARLSIKEWRAMRETIAAFFTDDWKHGRIERELTEAKAKYERRARAGREGGNARSAARQKASNANSNASPLLEQTRTIAVAYAGDARGNSQPQPHTHPSQEIAPDRLGTYDAGHGSVGRRLNGSAHAWDDDMPFGGADA